MGNLEEPNLPSFSDFPEDVQLCILSFLDPPDITSFACASKRHRTLARTDHKLWHAMCDRRWGAFTQIAHWGAGKISYKLLYRTLKEWENLIGFWRRSGYGHGASSLSSPPPLVSFQWGPSFVAGSRVSPSTSGPYEVVKAPFLWMGLSAEGEVVNFLHPHCRIDLPVDFVGSGRLGFSDEGDWVPVNVSFIGKCHVVVEENRGFGYSVSPEGKKINNGYQSSSNSTRRF